MHHWLIFIIVNSNGGGVYPCVSTEMMDTHIWATEQTKQETLNNEELKVRTGNWSATRNKLSLAFQLDTYSKFVLINWSHVLKWVGNSQWPIFLWEMLELMLTIKFTNISTCYKNSYSSISHTKIYRGTVSSLRWIVVASNSNSVQILTSASSHGNR